MRPVIAPPCVIPIRSASSPGEAGPSLINSPTVCRSLLFSPTDRATASWKSTTRAMNARMASPSSRVRAPGVDGSRDIGAFFL